MKRLFVSVFLILGFVSVKSQEWVNMMNEPGRNFYDIQAAFNSYWKGKDSSVPGSGYKPFKRWESFMEPRVYPSGDLSLVSKNQFYFQEFLEANATNKSIQNPGTNPQLSSSTTWTAMGPMGPMSGVATNGFPRKAGRDNFITFHPTNPSIFWAGAPAGGLWKTTDGGLTWSTNTDNLTVIGCSDLAIDSSNPNIMYLATGDGDAGDTYCIGVLKSTDGGNTWNTTGLTFAVSAQRQMRRLIIHPTNPQVLLAATNIGIYRTTNGGTSWTQVATGTTHDLEFKPGNPNIIYAGGTTFRLSADGGITWSTISNGIPTTGCNRMAIAVTPADTNFVYALRSNSSNSGYAGLYRSIDGGATFTVMSTTPNVLGNACNGTSTGGQGWFDLCIAVSPTDANLVNVGGVNVWRSNTGGATGTWTIIGCWIGTSAPGVYLKADHHDLEYDANGDLFSASDGGIFKYNVTNWIDLNANRNIAQIYKIGLSSLTANRWITGHQDNGTGLYTGTVYQASYAGDGMDCFIDRTNDQNLFTSTPYGAFVRSTNGGASYSSITSGITGSGAWVTPWKQDPVVATRLYAGRSQMFVSNNLGTSWTQLTATGGGGAITEFAIAPSNNQVIYVIHGTNSVLRKTTDGGLTWTAATALPVGAPTFITISPTDPNTLWVTVSGYTAGSKVFQSTNGGTSWVNVSSNLPNLPANCSVYQPGTNDRIYVGMDVGVYYKDNSSVNWTLYNIGLPNAPISDMEISTAAPGLLRAATYGRGVYEVDVIQTTAAPISNFTSSGPYCENSNFVLQDASTNSPTSWLWTVNPASTATLSSTSAQNPTLSVSVAGIYTVSLQSNNTIGPGNVYTNTILVHPNPLVVFSSAAPAICLGESISISASGGSTYNWQPGNLNGATVTLNPGSTQEYTCTVTDENGCKNSSTVLLSVSECVGLSENKIGNSALMVYPNPSKDKLFVVFKQDAEVHLTVRDLAGRLLLEHDCGFSKSKSELQLNISGFPKGVYLLQLKESSGKEHSIRFAKE
jgi:hypothetical protein